ncbi:UDP-glucose 4-epimerase GalE [Parvicella tangerina]|uniref:UDP-glucose 4-epimerase n=1 Tax=Parvicella tangerina TaxID=2829795 RepID=A0A916JIZ8_9FLAO|nr:UDP-glucose 4-epimerase GalE [Parvicella tangerina]CAG5076363.1 UDP-glucose 4-epimerase [Parvicella tangerina]
MESGKYIIVTGGAGFIGSHTVVSLLESGYSPIIIDDFRNSKKFILDRLEEITGKSIVSFDFDCSNQEKLREVFSTYEVHGIIHFAADKAVGESVLKPLKYYENNLQSLVSMLKISEEFSVTKFVFSSSCTVYGEPDQVPVDENAPIKYTASPYGYTKQVCERICADTAYASDHLRITLLRYFNPIGAHPSGLIGELPLGVPNNLVPFVTQTAIGIRQELTVFGDDYPTTDGTCIRDYIHVCDLADAHVRALESNSDEEVSIYNVGTGVGSTVLEVVNTFEEVNGVKVKHKIGPRREGDAAQVYADNKKITEALHWKAKYTLSDALKHAWNWQKNLDESR